VQDTAGIKQKSLSVKLRGRLANFAVVAFDNIILLAGRQCSASDPRIYLTRVAGAVGACRHSDAPESHPHRLSDDKIMTVAAADPGTGSRRSGHLTDIDTS
jgi:hypothetical protein